MEKEAISCHTKNYRTLDIEHLNLDLQMATVHNRNFETTIRLQSIIKNIRFYNINSGEPWNNDQIIFCSDGGAQNNKGSFGIVASINEEIILRNKNRIPIVYNEANSHCSEAFGMLGALLSYNNLRRYATKTQLMIPKNIKIVCDNSSLVDTVNKYRIRKRMTKYYYSADNDVITEILYMVNTLVIEGCNIRIIHVRGHQDHKVTKSQEEILNIEADALATEALKKATVQDYPMPKTVSTLKLNGRKVVAKHTLSLRRAYNSMNLHDYLQQTYNWSNKVMESLWWDPHCKAIAAFGKEKIMVIQKFNHTRWE
jgi:ribonuclease HI